MKKNLCATIAILLVTGGSMASEAKHTIGVNFALVANGENVSCANSAIMLGKSKTATTLKDARLYIHDLALLTADGRSVPVQLDQNEWQYLSVALLDFEDAQGNCGGNPATHSRVTGKVLPGQYVGLQFMVGVPISEIGAGGKTVSLNHSSTEQINAPLDIQAMAWNWQGGRKFVKIEVSPEGGVKRANDTIKVWPVHLGATGCVGNPAAGESVNCSQQNRFPVRFDRFNLVTDQIDLDIGNLFSNSDLTQDLGGAAGCMSSPVDPECPAIFQQLGLPLGNTPAASVEVSGAQKIFVRSAR